jgi:hypothetical protein
MDGHIRNYTTTPGQLSSTSVCSMLLQLASQQPCQEKGLANKNKIALVTAPGQIVFVNQMQSTAPGMVGQINGIPTRQRYHYVTVFVNQISGLSFVHLQKTSSGEETLDAKFSRAPLMSKFNTTVPTMDGSARPCG